MTTEITVPPSITKQQADAAPAASAAPAVAGSTDEALQPQPATGHGNGFHLEPTKRTKTWGERLFDFTTYAGFGLIGNEATASWIVSHKKKPESLIGRAMQAGDAFFKKIGTPGKLPYIQERMNYISFAIIGGFAVVPFIKFLEDSKGRCVRFADRIFYGERANDPQIAKKHEEMDNAPQQSWGSLGKGRVLTVAAAYTVDSTVNWEGGLLARSLKGTRFENYGSFEHLSSHASEWLNNKIAPMRKLTPEKALQQKDFIKTMVGLTTLSAVLTLLFYASSKLFAKKRDERIERRQQDTMPNTPQRDDASELPSLDSAAPQPQAQTPPSPQVSAIERDAATVAHAQLAQAH